MTRHQLIVFVLGSYLLVRLAGATCADTFGSGANSFEIEFVTIGDPGNLDDPADGFQLPGMQNFGSVRYKYRIGKYEIAEHMIVKANVEGLLGITIDMRGANKPATSISWYEAAQFVNWLNTSSGFSPAYKFDDSGNFRLWTTGDAGFDGDNVYRNSRAKYFLPSADEWYKAAYYDPDSETYFRYPTGSNAVPVSVTSGNAPGTAVWGRSFQAGPADVTLAGGLSPFGTMGQGGNVWEWEETDYDLTNGPSVNPVIGLRGGDWSESNGNLLSHNRYGGSASSEIENQGFRVASIFVPEPGTLTLLTAVIVGQAFRRHLPRIAS